MAEKNLNIKVTADAKDAESTLKKVTSELNKFANNKSINTFNKATDSAGKLFKTYKTVINITKKAVAAVNECTKAYNTQAKAEKQLETAAKNNPYLNNSNVSQLKKFAGELQFISAVGDEELLPLMAQLASAGRTQAEIQDIMKAALDVSASGTMSLESAVKNLNKTYSGLSGELGENIPEIKNLTKEQLQNGDAIAIIQKKYKGMAEEVTKSTGGMTKLKNSLGDLKEVLGEVPAKIKNAVGNTLSGFVDNIAEKMKIAKEEAQHFRDILEFKDVVKNGTDSLEKMQSSVQGLQTELEHLKDVKNAYLNSEEMKKEAKAERDAALKEYEDLKEKYNQIQSLRNELSSTQIALNYFETHGGSEKVIESTKNRYLELKEKISSLEEEYYTKIDEAEKKADEANENYKKRIKEIRNLEKEVQKGVTQSVTVDDILDPQIKKLEKDIELGKQRLELLKEEDALKNKQAERDKLNNEASDAKQAFWKKIEEYNKEAELKKQIAKESNQAYSEEEEIAGRINLMNIELYKLLQENNGVTFENWEVQNAIIPALQEQVAQYKEILALKEKNGNLEDVDEWENAKDIIKNWNTTEEDVETVLQIQKETLQEYQAYLSEYGKNTEEEIKLEEDLKNAISKIDDAMIQERKQKFADLTSLVCDYINQFADISGQATDLLRQSNEAQTNEELNALSVQYTDGLISYEEYCTKKEEIDKKSAQKEYKLKMWEWQVSILQATANIAQGITSCLTQGFPLGLINGALIGASGALQIASLMASKPTPPAFASGGIVGATTGPDNTIATVRTGEMILNAAQQKHLWELANGKNGNGAVVNMPITIENKASNEVSAKSQLSADGLRIVIDKMVDNSIRKGRYTQSLQIAENNRTGGKFL